MKKAFQLFAALFAAVLLGSCHKESKQEADFVVDYFAFQAEEDGEWGLMDSDGKVVVKPRYDNMPTCVINDMFSVYDEDDAIFTLYQIGKGAKPKKIGTYKDIGAYTGKLCPVVDDDNNMSYIDTDGKKVIDLKKLDGEKVMSAFNFFNGRIAGVIDAYKSYTSDLLMLQSLPAILGYTRTYNNIGKTENVGLDLTLNLVPVRTRDWEWTVDINAAYTKNKITELANGATEDLSNNWFVGESIGSVYGFRSAGIWQASDAAEMAKYNANGNKFQPGMARPMDIANAEDENHNPIYKIDDNYDKVILGCTMPRWTFGFNTAVSYKNWTLSAQLYGRFKFLSGSDAPWVGGRYNVRKYDYWTESNTDAKYTKPIFSEAGEDQFYQTVDNWMDRSYLKVRNISLGYTFPAAMLRNTGVSALRLYVQGKNLGSIFNRSEVRDMDTGNTYYNRGFTFGVNVTF